MPVNAFDVQIIHTNLYFLTVETRVPLKFGSETLTSVTVARVKVQVRNRAGRIAEGWGETPLSVQWVWPSQLSYHERNTALKDFTKRLTKSWANFDLWGDPIEIGYSFQKHILDNLIQRFNHDRGDAAEPIPWLAGLVCTSPFDIALHDAYGVVHKLSTYNTYTHPFMNYDLGHYLHPSKGSNISFQGLYPSDFMVAPIPHRIPAWHLVGGLDLLEPTELTGNEPDDDYPVLLSDWITRDGLKCLKVKLRGNDPEWDYRRLVKVAEIGNRSGVDWLSSDFNCTVTDPRYVNDILDRMVIEHPRIYGMILYVEQPFPYDLEKYQIDVHSVSARKPLFMDESAHDWELVRLGRSLGWTGVALKTCKTQTGSLLSLCWAKAHGMTLMVQDLTNPMLAQIPHVLLAANAGTIMGVETNAMQFYPQASLAEAAVHPGLYRRNNGTLDLSTLGGLGFGYRLEEIARQLPDPVSV